MLIKMRTYIHCTGMIRGQFYDVNGRRITIFGVHAKRYTIEIISISGIAFYESFPNGALARKRWAELKRRR